MFNIGPLELFALVALGVLLFGRDLPSVGRKLGQTFAQFRRGLHDFKQQFEQNADLREIKQSMQEIKRVADMPRQIANPGRMLRDLTDEALATPAETPRPENGSVAPEQKQPSE